MKTYIQLYNPKTGDLERIYFPDTETAFKRYWELTDNPPEDIEFELITTTADELLDDGEKS
jgi:hypothetical protein